MSESSNDSSHSKALTLNVPVPDGWTTGETFTVSITLSSGTSPSNAKTRKQWTSRDGSKSWSESERQMVEDLALLSTRNEAAQKRKSSTPRSHYGCWCNFSFKEATDDVIGHPC